MADGNSGYRKKDMGRSAVNYNEFQVMRDYIFGCLVQLVMHRDHGVEVEAWGQKAAEEASGLVAGLGAMDYQDLMLQIQADPQCDLFAEIAKFNKRIPSDA